jgi:hypothetical protein
MYKVLTLRGMKKLLLIIIPVVLIACSKGKKDTAYNYKCTSQCKLDPFTIKSTDTFFFNITDGEANLYARDRTAQTGCNTTCERQ